MVKYLNFWSNAELEITDIIELTDITELLI